MATLILMCILIIKYERRRCRVEEQEEAGAPITLVAQGAIGRTDIDRENSQQLPDIARHAAAEEMQLGPRTMEQDLSQEAYAIHYWQPYPDDGGYVRLETLRIN